MGSKHYTRLLGPAGSPLNAELTVDVTTRGLEIILESRSGAKTSSRLRNSDYIPALELLLTRLAAASAVLIEASVESRPARELAEDQRRLRLEWPLTLRPGMDVRQLRLRIGHAQRDVASDPSKQMGTGNAQKRLRLLVDLTGLGEVTDLRERLGLVT